MSTINSASTGTTREAQASSLLTDLYVSLRRSLQKWAAVTHQTPQPRMGYVGQHLVSVVTGHPGGRSGARGDDIKLPNGRTAEIKCCYRVDQLGICKKCGAKVARIEKVCPIARKSYASFSNRKSITLFSLNSRTCLRPMTLT